MRSFKRLLLAVLFTGVFLAQGFHDHAGHDGGLSAPHVDCALCSWNHARFMPSVGAEKSALVVALLTLLLSLWASLQKQSPALSLASARAPPAA